jgi:cytoskeletal protein CcmA (bactofilin family)
MRSGDSVILAEDEVINGDYFAAGDNAVISGIVNGDVYVAGDTVIVDGTVNGDIMAAGRDIEIRGTVAGDVRAVGGSVTIPGTIQGNLTVGSSRVYIAQTAVLGGSLLAGAGELVVLAPVGKDITAGVGSMTVEQSVGGDITYWSDKDALISSEASVSGTVKRHDTPDNRKEKGRQAAGAAVGGVTTAAFFGMLSSFLLGALLIYAAPNYIKNAVHEMRYRTKRSLLAGFAVLILSPIAIMLLMVTGIGAPIGVIGLMLYIVILMVAKTFAELLVGTRVLAFFRKNENPYLSLGVGVLLMGVLMLIPVVGWIIAVGAYFIALGGITMYKSELFKSLSHKKII